MNSPPTKRFSGRAVYYSSHRPGYPHQLVELLIREARLTGEAAIADIGSGTGISSGLLVNKGFRVFAVEPNASMRTEAERAFANEPRFVSVEGTAESTTLRSQSVRLAMAGTAFHWFDEAAARVEFLRILEPGGMAAIFWNRRMDGSAPGDTCDFSRQYERFLHEHTAYASAVHRVERTPQSLAVFFGGEPAEAHFENAQHLEFEGLLGRLLSSSYAPLPDSPGYEAAVRELRDLFDRNQQQGFVTMRYDTCVFYGPMAEASS
jgi:SAM-dependent methyltransferase